jgi:hypothetical protein
MAAPPCPRVYHIAAADAWGTVGFCSPNCARCLIETLRSAQRPLRLATLGDISIEHEN